MQHAIRFGLRSSQHHRSWAQIKENFQAAEGWGFESAWVFDHIIPLSDPRTGPNLDGWTLLAGLAEATKTVEIGPMVTGVTYRNPGMLLKSVTTVDHISNGRALLGIGAAWFEGEHTMYGIEFPPAGARVSMLREALTIFRGLQSQERTTFEGKHYQVRAAIFEPKPVRNPMPVVIGGSQPRMLRIIAEFADQWDNNFRDPAEYKARLAHVEEHCRKIGRDPSEIRRSTTLGADFYAKRDDDQLTQLEALRALGMTDFLFHAPDDLNDMRGFAETTVPRLRQAWSS
jgi:F420-dependent oxidoreductase-like protein